MGSVLCCYERHSYKNKNNNIQKKVKYKIVKQDPIKINDSFHFEKDEGKKNKIHIISEDEISRL